MSLSSQDTQIKKAYEDEGMIPSQIAEALSFDETAVKAKLMQISSVYRKDCGKEDEKEEELNFSNDDLKFANKVIMESAASATNADGSIDYRTRLNAATYIRDDKKGRKEIVRAIQNNSFNILAINDLLRGASEGANKIKDSLKRKAIEV